MSDPNINILHDIDAIDPAAWRRLADASAVATVFQTEEFCRAVEATGCYRILVVAAEQDGSLVGLVAAMVQAEGRGLRRRLSSRAIVNGGPLLADGIRPEALAALLRAAVADLRRGATYIECRNLHDYSAFRPVFEACGFRYKPHYNFHIDTSSADEAYNRISKRRRRQLRQAEREGATISDSPSHLHDFYLMLSDLYSRRVHRPLPPEFFFRVFLNTPLAHLLAVLDTDGQVIGGLLLLVLDGRAVYLWYACGDDSRHDLFPSAMANYAAIAYAVDHGLPLCDMMGAGSPGDGGYGVRDFKARFGGQLVEHGRFLYVLRPLVYHTAAVLLKLLKR